MSLPSETILWFYKAHIRDLGCRKLASDTWDFFLFFFLLIYLENSFNIDKQSALSVVFGLSWCEAIALSLLWLLDLLVSLELAVC